jgi:hypothetical protein
MLYEQRVRDYLNAGESWFTFAGRPDDYVYCVLSSMARLKHDYPDADYPPAIHSVDEKGACAECDAIRMLTWETA